MATIYSIGDDYPVLPTKDSNGNLDYGFEWRNSKNPWLGSSEAITNSVWTSTVGITLSNDSINGTKTVVFISGGAHGRQYKITNTITTNGGSGGIPRTTVRSFILPIRDL